MTETGAPSPCCHCCYFLTSYHFLLLRMPRNRTQRRAAAVASSRVKEDENDGDSEWEESSSQQEESSFDDESESLQHTEEESSQAPTEASEEEVAPPKKKPAKKKAASKKRKAASISSESDGDYDDEKDFMPTFARKTAKGGYSHTSKSRARISKANKGNTPWNKGKNRSAGVKAKIAAGVRARNRANLLEKLKKLGMTEDEWLAKKKEIKYLRERLRKAKKAAKEREENVKRKGKNADKSYEDLQKELSNKLAEQVKAMNPDEVGEDKEIKATKEAVVQSKQELLSKVFKPHVQWTKHDYDTHDRLYEQLCPTGGPGGLICCEVCSNAYSRYLTQTSTDAEEQSIHNAATEVQECTEFAKQTQKKLQGKVKAARRQAPPLPRDSAPTKTTSQSNTQAASV